VGAKPFSESEILAEMVVQLAENRGVEVQRKIPYGPTREVMEALKQDAIDIYPEYNGTALTFLGQAPTSDGAKSTEIVNKLFKPQGLELARGFGFANDYAMVMTTERAQELGVSRISELAGVLEGVTYAVDEDFVQRPADGLQQMNRRYGITDSSVETFPLGTEGKDQIVSALLDGSADVGELFMTDGQIAEYGLVVLEDDQKFFPVYEAAPLLRTASLTEFPALSGVLDALAGVITAQDMQGLNKAVDLDAQTPATVATGFLVAKGLLPEGAEGDVVQKLLVATGPDVDRRSEIAKALRAIRAGFAGNDVELSRSDSPLTALSDGSARVALVGAESFYTLTLGEDGPQRTGNAEAFAVVGFTTSHLIGLRGGDASASIAEMSRIVTGPEGSGSARVLEMILSSLGVSDRIEVIHSDAPIESQVSGLTDGDYHGVFVMAPQGDRAVAAALNNAAVGLVSLDEWAEGGHTARFSFIRPATIAAGTYPSQFGPISSVSTQLVLAGPAAQQKTAGDVGPGTSGSEGGATAEPITADTVATIRETLGAGELIDPAIPVHASLVPAIKVEDKSLPFSLDVSIMNILLIAFLLWALYLLGKPSPRSMTMPEDD
jgi:glycine betaine/choline ABC-type transport system substrate-binding protein